MVALVGSGVGCVAGREGVLALIVRESSRIHVEIGGHLAVLAGTGEVQGGLKKLVSAFRGDIGLQR